MHVSTDIKASDKSHGTTYPSYPRFFDVVELMSQAHSDFSDVIDSAITPVLNMTMFRAPASANRIS